MSEKRHHRVMTGTVVSDKMEKTVVVKVTRLVPHPVYKRIIKRSKRYKAHDEQNRCALGDTIRIVESRPLSRDKRWRVLEVVEKTP